MDGNEKVYLSEYNPEWGRQFIDEEQVWSLAKGEAFIIQILTVSNSRRLEMTRG